jgi:hypothetical protein
MIACGNDDNYVVNPKTEDLYDVSKVVEETWKLTGFGTMGEAEVQQVTGEVDYQGNEINYIIRFNDDGMIMGHTVNNEMSGVFSIDEKTILISSLGTDMAMETKDGKKFLSALRSGPIDFETRGDQLLLYYNERQDFLRFDKMTFQEDEPYEPFLREGKIWKYSYKNPAGTEYMQTLIVKGDTTIGGLIYKKIYDADTNTYQYALHEDGKKVYCKRQNNEMPKLLYDFGKNYGEKVSEEIGLDLRTIVRVIDAGKVKSGDYTLHRMWVSIYTAPLGYAKNGEIKALTNGRWIEGIGSIYGLDSPFVYDGNYFIFHSCWIGDKELGNNGLFY